MADNPILNRVSGFAAQPVTRQMALLIGMAASVALGVGVIQWAMKPDFQPLYGAMSPADNATAVSLLQANGIPYTMAGGSGLLSVPSDQIPQARMALASEGFPRGGGVGFESLYQEQEMGLSSFMEQARYNRAVEAELARTISAMDSVKGARVHVAASKQSAFIRRGQEPSASVMVSLYPGRGLSERQLAGIVHLVASSIPELQASKVSVVDQAGKLLSSQDGEDNDFGYTSEQFRIAQQLEDSLNDRIESILEPILGVGAVRAQVTADLDFTRVESTSEQYSPETIMRSEQTTEDLTLKSVAAEGVPGQLADQPPGAADPAGEEDPVAEAPSPTRESRKATRNFEMDKTISHVREVPGKLLRLSVAVVVDYITDEDGNRAALEQGRLDEITTLVREAVGFDDARGDTVSVINSPFVVPEALEEIPEPGLLEQDWIWQAGKGALALIALLMLIFTVIRPLIRYSTSYTPPPPPPSDGLPQLAGPMAADGGGINDDTVALSGPAQAALPGTTTPAYHQSIAMARNVVNEQPARAAYVVKNWMATDG
ncbi:MAG: flagellar basal-body MS-ring/collar protein FliF [Luminiphilus sp.]|nr:flagellar basal-body MS-ring/collar protein FliF [Luminiphilus sp.]MDG1461490.1 flagellar basal-body MS-ring/collar protein FliF [Luminiphilus sp.]